MSFHSVNTLYSSSFIGCSTCLGDSCPWKVRPCQRTQIIFRYARSKVPLASKPMNAPRLAKTVARVMSAALSSQEVLNQRRPHSNIHQSTKQYSQTTRSMLASPLSKRAHPQEILSQALSTQRHNHWSK